MRAETSATSAVAALSVAVAAVGHTLVAGGPVPTSSLVPLTALAGACWLLGDHLAGRLRMSVAVLAGVQVVVHLTLGATPHHNATTGTTTTTATTATTATKSATSAALTQQPVGHTYGHQHGAAAGLASSPSAGQSGLADALTMTVAHLAALLVAVVVLARAHGWVARIRRILGRLVPELPAALVPVPTVGRLLTGVPGRAPVAQRWLPSNVSRRGPPALVAVTALS